MITGSEVTSDAAKTNGQTARKFVITDNTGTHTPGADDVNRESGTECAIQCWLQ